MIIRKKVLRNKIAFVILAIIIGLLINNANTSPGGQELLRINNQGNTKFEVHANGRVGIGTSSPANHVDIAYANGDYALGVYRNGDHLCSDDIRIHLITCRGVH